MATKARVSTQLYWDADVDINGKKLTNSATPTNASDVANKAYVDGILDSLNGLQNKGGIDCSSNPNYPAASNGHLYVVTVGGKIGGASGDSVSAGDLLLCKNDSTVSGDKATVGTYWDIVHVAGASGTVISSSGSAVDNSIVRMDSTTGALIQTSLVTIDDTGSINLPSGQTYKINNVALNQDHFADGTTNKAYTAAEKTKLSGIDTSALGLTSILSHIVTREAPTGTKNGSNTAFTLAYTPQTGTEEVYLNGWLLNAGAGNDYTISGATITMLTAPISTDTILVNYWK